MTVEAFASPTHKAVVFSYDQSLVKGKKATITAENAETGDVGVREVTNTGTFVLFYPFNFTGTDNITVSGNGHSEDSGTVEVE